MSPVIVVANFQLPTHIISDDRKSTAAFTRDGHRGAAPHLAKALGARLGMAMSLGSRAMETLGIHGEFSWDFIMGNGITMGIFTGFHRITMGTL